MDDYRKLIHLATRLPELAFSTVQVDDDEDPINIIHRRFDRVLEKLEMIQKKIAQLKYRPSYVIPVTGGITGLVKYCRQLKERRDSQATINHRCYIKAYQNAYERLHVIANHAKQVQHMESESA